MTMVAETIRARVCLFAGSGMEAGPTILSNDVATSNVSYIEESGEHTRVRPVLSMSVNPNP
jgi:hypothetical protein